MRRKKNRRKIEIKFGCKKDLAYLCNPKNKTLGSYNG